MSLKNVPLDGTVLFKKKFYYCLVNECIFPFAVHDVSGLIEATGCDSESEDDEWKFITGDEADKQKLENIQQQQQQRDEDEEDDTMSQLNPNAAEFVPVSPVRSEPSPACTALIFNDQVIAQSPSKGAITQELVDINIPNELDFEKEVKSRPSELFCEEENETITTAIIEPEPKSNGVVQEENLLNGKSSKDEEDGVNALFRLDEFHFGPNATPFVPPKVVDSSPTDLIEEVNIDSVLDVISLNKVEDPMSMSFYQERDESEEKNTLLDLNQVQLIPDDLDDFLQQKSDEKEVICNDNVVEVTDLDDKKYVIEEEEKELESPQEINEIGILEPVEMFENTKDNDVLIETKTTECDNLNFAQEISNATQEIIDLQPEIVESVPQPTNPFLEETEIEEEVKKVEEPIVEQVEEEMKQEIVEIPVSEEPKLEVNEFLERTQVESLLSPIEQNDLMKEIAEQTVKIEKELKLEPEIKVEEVKKTTKTSNITKKPLTKMAPAKTAPPKPRTLPTATKSTTTTTTAAKPATKLVPKPKVPPVSSTLTKQTAKPMNGDFKTATRPASSTLKKTVESTSKLQSTRTSLTQRTITKTTTDSGLQAKTSARRPITASGDVKSSATTKVRRRKIVECINLIVFCD